MGLKSARRLARRLILGRKLSAYTEGLEAGGSLAANAFAPALGGFRVKDGTPALSDDERRIVDSFAELYYRRWQEGGKTIVLSWLGYQTLKCPLDLWIYQELIADLRPDWIVECGTRFGGNALYLACICELLGHGRVVTIDTDDSLQPVRPLHPRIRYLAGSSTDPAIVAQVKTLLASAPADGGAPDGQVLVILDSDHSRDHVLAELRTYAPLIRPGGYLLVEDSNVNGHPANRGHGPGPWEAIDAFLAETGAFVSDRSLERFLLTMNPRGYLRRVE
jgi:cephalosporin hydroxylase